MTVMRSVETMGTSGIPGIKDIPAVSQCATPLRDARFSRLALGGVRSWVRSVSQPQCRPCFTMPELRLLVV